MSLKHRIKNIAYFLANIFSYFFPSLKASILMYHSVGNNGILFTVTEKDFERQMKYLKDKKYNVIKLVELAEKLKNKEKVPPKTVVLTFDDAYRDNYLNAFPLLKKYNISATIFVPTAYIGKEMINSEGKSIPVMNWQEARKMEESGIVDFASHSHTHPPMNQIAFEEFINEVKTSENLLNQNLKRPVKIFSFPKGKYKPEHANYIKKQNYLGAVTVKEGLVGPSDNLFTLKRNFVFSKGGFSQFKGKLGRSAEIMNWLKKDEKNS